MPEVAVAYHIARKITTYEMTLKILKKDVNALKITLVQLDLASCDLFNVEKWVREKLIFLVSTTHAKISNEHKTFHKKSVPYFIPI